jgi:hypothetical protein
MSRTSGLMAALWGELRAEGTGGRRRGGLLDRLCPACPCLVVSNAIMGVRPVGEWAVAAHVRANMCIHT